MPRAPHTAARLEGLGGSVFERFLPRIREKRPRPTKLHIGDAADPPTYDLPLDPEFRRDRAHWFQYPNTAGIGRLRRALADHHRSVHGLDTEPDQILVTSGATNALSSAMQALIDPGDEVIVPTPSWPFVRGMVRMAGGIVREIPFYTSGARDEGLQRIEDAIGERTAAVYVNTPNNPSARVLDVVTRRALLEIAEGHGLWVISDEAYDGMAYDGRTTHPLALYSSRPETVLSVYTFSKIFRFAGLRLGWLRAAAPMVGSVDRALVHSVYSASSLAQELVLDPVRQFGRWSTSVAADLQARRDLFVGTLDLPIEPCEGTYFVFFDAAPFCDRGRNPEDLIVECLDEGVLVAPGGDFGTDYGSWMRACFAAESRDAVEDAARRLRRVLAR